GDHRAGADPADHAGGAGQERVRRGLDGPEGEGGLRVRRDDGRTCGDRLDHGDRGVDQGRGRNDGGPRRSKGHLTGSGVAAQAPSTPAAEKSSGQFGLSTAIALIMGSIIGVGIFNLPTSLAPYGPITLVSLGLTTVGALVLAILFGALSRRMPADGGPY